VVVGPPSWARLSCGGRTHLGKRVLWWQGQLGQDNIELVLVGPTCALGQDGLVVVGPIWATESRGGKTVEGKTVLGKTVLRWWDRREQDICLVL
jgi:hypothetical protein